jgi:hypothetical protein
MPVEPKLVVTSMQVSNLYHIIDEEPDPRRRGLGIGAQTDLPEHINMARGRMYETDTDDGIIEVIVSNLALENTEMMIGREYQLYSYRQGREDAEPLFTVTSCRCL